MKHWTQREANGFGNVTPDLINEELRVQQSSITTLDRAQLPQGDIDDAYLVDNALHQVWESNNYPAGGEQTVERDTNTKDYSFGCSTIQVMSGGWQDIGGSTLTLTGFKGGNLMVEWSCNVYVCNVFALGASEGKPGSPMFMRMRILVNGVTVCERRGGGYHQNVRLVGSEVFPPGDLSVQFQYRMTEPSQDYAQVTSNTNNVGYGHIWNSRYFILARYR
jgi:hypothetical protein